jgi:hypothetical protein
MTPKAKIRALTAAAAISFGSAAPLHAATLTVVNDTDEYVTVSVDGAYGCNTAGHTTCRIPVSAGVHNLRAQTANGQVTSINGAEIPGDGRTWTISPVATACSQRARASEARIAAWNTKCTGASSVRTPALYQWCASERSAMKAAEAQILADCPH